MKSQAFIDESARGKDYYLVAATVAHGDVDALRRLSRSFCMPGQRRWHFVNEKDSRRRQTLETLVADPLLWVADAFAWCASAGGVWKARIIPAISHTWEVNTGP